MRPLPRLVCSGVVWVGLEFVYIYMYVFFLDLCLVQSEVGQTSCLADLDTEATVLLSR